MTVTTKKLKEKITLQLEDIKSKQKINVSDNKIKNLTIISQERKNKIDYKRKMNYEIIDEIHFIGLEKFVKYDKLNPISITIQSNDINAYLTRYSKYKYRFIITDLLFNTSFANETFVICIRTNGLVNSKKSIIDGKIYKCLGQVNINEIDGWEKLKGKGKWVNIVFNNSELNPTAVKHFAYGFVTKNLNDLLNFDVIFLDGKGKEIKFNSTSKKVPSLDFVIQILK